MERVNAGSVPLAGIRAVFLAMIAASVALHGGTQPATIPLLTWTLAAVVCTCLVIGLISGRSLFPGAKAVFWLSLFVMAFGWLSALTPASVYSRDFRAFLPIEAQSWWPFGTVDGDLSFMSMLRLTAMLVALWVASDMGQSPLWRRALVVTIASLGLAVAVFGLLQKGMGDLGGYWGNRKLPPSVFGPFWYHANAGAFLNLCWPLAAAGVVTAARSLQSSNVKPQVRLALWLLALLIMVAAVWVNVSKGAQAIFVLQSILMALVIFLQWRQNRGTGFKAGHWIVFGVLAVLLGTLLYFLGLQQGIDRWNHLLARRFEDGRWIMAAACRPLISEAGAMGFGPGTFAAVFVVKSLDSPNPPRGYWEFAHNDYLQTLLEWGWLGIAAWVALGGCVLWLLGGRILRAFQSGDMKSFVWKSAFLISLGATVIHAALDFPLQIFAIQLVAACLAGITLADEGAGVRLEKGMRRRKHRD